MWFPSSSHSQASASPDLGIESDHGRFSSLDTQTTKSTAISISEFILLTFKKSLVKSFPSAITGLVPKITFLYTSFLENCFVVEKIILRKITTESETYTFAILFMK